jgi:DNA-binding winged helix-turn-helix (wHTH) protein
MLNSHKNLLASRPSDRLRIGGFIVDLSLREISSADDHVDPIRITLKAQGVLLVLVAHAGNVVSREALLEWVWPDTMPNDDVVTQAITLLRKSFGDSRKQTTYIETISKYGYRLIAPIEWLAPEQSAADRPQAAPFARQPAPGHRAETTTPSSVRQYKRGIMVASAAALLGILAYAFLRVAPPLPIEGKPGRTSPASSGEKVFQRIVSSPAAEYAPSLSPDGSLLAYVRFAADGSGSSVLLQTASPLSPKPLTEAQIGRWDMMPSWSPDGRQIAFARSTDSGCSIMLVPTAGGSARELGDCLGAEAQTIAWYPDGKALLVAGQPMQDGANGVDTPRNLGSTLFRMALDTGRWEPVPYDKTPSDHDVSPAVSRDGRWIAFHRNAALGDIWRVPVAGGVPQRLTRLQTNIFGLAWMPDSDGIVFARYKDGIKQLSKLDIPSGRLMDYSIGSGDVEYPSVAQDSGAIALQIEEARASMRRMSLADGRSAFTNAATPYETTRSNRLPAVSPDGEQLMFVSDRTGRPQLWWAEGSRTDSLRPIEGFVPSPRFPVAWNPTSERVLAIGEGAEGRGVYEIEPRRGRAVRLPTPDGDPAYAAYHPDPSRLLVVANRGEGRFNLTLYDRSATPWRALSRIEEDIGVSIVDHANARILYVLRAKPEIWATDLSLQKRVLVDSLERRGQGRLKTFASALDGVWFLDSRPDCAWFWRQVAVSGSEAVDRTAGTCLGDLGSLELQGIAYDARSRQLYVSTLEYTTHDIGFLPVSAQSLSMRNVTR